MNRPDGSQRSRTRWRKSRPRLPVLRQDRDQEKTRIDHGGYGEGQRSEIEVYQEEDDRRDDFRRP